MDKMINPLKDIKIEHCPIQIFSHDNTSWFGKAVLKRTGGECSHTMMMIRPGFVVSQGIWTYKEYPITDFLKPDMFMEFWWNRKLITGERLRIITAIANELKKPWWARRYDFLGIMGQATGLRWLNVPWAFYCSERDASWWRLVFEFLPKRPSPAMLRKEFMSIASFKNMGEWSGCALPQMPDVR